MTTPEQLPEPSSVPARTKRGSRKQIAESPLDPAEVLTKLLASSGEMTVKRQESEAERDHRLAIEKMKAEQEIWKERRILWTYIISVATIEIVAIAALIWSSDAAARNWASGALTSILVGLASFIAGKSMKS